MCVRACGRVWPLFQRVPVPKQTVPCHNAFNCERAPALSWMKEAICRCQMSHQCCKSVLIVGGTSLVFGCMLWCTWKMPACFQAVPFQWVADKGLFHGVHSSSGQGVWVFVKLAGVRCPCELSAMRPHVLCHWCGIFEPAVLTQGSWELVVSLFSFVNVPWAVQDGSAEVSCCV